MSAATSAAWLMALIMLTEGLLAEEVMLTLNTKKPLTVTSEKFLSFTLDPTYILTGNVITENPEKCINMARALSPAYVRVAGPRSNSYTFARAYMTQEEDPNFIFTETQWNTLNGWAANSGLDVVAALAPQLHSEASGTATRDAVWDSRNVLDLISSSDHMGFNVSWQLGYECQTRCDISGGDLGKDVMRLRRMLEAFPRFAGGIIVGPDVVTFKTKLQQFYLQEYLNAGVGALSAITWHPNFASITLDTVGVSMHHDNLAMDKDALYRIIGRHMAKKPLWLAESKPEECKKQFLGALVWTRRLGNSAKLGAQVLMRQPQESNLFEPTPDYWVSVIHKTLVGRKVLDTKIATGNRTHIHFYCQCTRPSSKYEKGSLTVFGINLTPTKLVVSLKGLKIKTLHKYILLPGFDAENRMFSETVLLNNEPLKLENGKDMPEINPAVSSSGKGLSMKLPSGGIGFWVIPDLKVKPCEGQENDNGDKMVLKKWSKRLAEFESEENSTNEERDAQEIEDNSDERRPFIKASRKRRRKSGYSTEQDEVMRYKKVDARRDLERLEKLLKWRENLEERRISTLRGKSANIGFEDKSYEMNSDNESEEKIRAKLQLYRRRLDEYEVRKRNLIGSRDKQTFAESDALDNEKIQEAMQLITKVENAMKNFEEETHDSLNVGNNVAAGLNSTNAEEHFLDELLKTRKIKRTSVPVKIEEQLRGIYEMLAEEKERRQRLNEEKLADEVTDEPLLRRRRDVDKKFGDDPLGLRKDLFFTRRRSRNEDIKERRLGKYRKKGEKKDNGPVFFDPKNPSTRSSENNFYGFARQEPIKGFPQGDVYVTTGVSGEEKMRDYDYVCDDEYMPDQGKRKKSKNAEIINPHELEYPWVEDENSEIGDIPKEFLDNIPLNSPKIHRHLENYVELWEAESLVDAPETQRDEKCDPAGEKIVHEKLLNKSQDKRTKETIVKRLMGYYENPPSHQSDEDDTVFGPRYEEAERSVEYARSSLTSQYGNPSNVNTRHRRDVHNLDSVLDKEMIFQDENNLKDCHCRVIRGLKNIECKLRSRIAEKTERAQAKRLTRSKKPIRKSVRTRRDTSSEEEYEYTDADDESLSKSEEHQHIKLDRDTASQSTVSPPPMATLSPTNPPTETKQFFQSSKNINKSTRAQEKISQTTSDAQQNSENMSFNNTESNPTHPINSPFTKTPPYKVFTPGMEDPFSRTQSITHSPQENKKEKNLMTTPEILENTKSMKIIPRAPRRTPPKIKPIPKALDNAKVREARLAARSEALLAKRGNDSKRSQKIADFPSNVLAAETTKLQEVHKKRLEELEKLKEKLKNKRTKLQQSILTEELEKSSDAKAKNIKRREIMQLLNEEQELQRIVDKGKWNYLMLYKPINYALPAKMNSEEDVPERKYIHEDIAVVRPLHDTRVKKTDSIPATDYQRNPSILTYTENIENTESLINSASIEDELLDDLCDAIVGSLEDSKTTQYPSTLLETNGGMSNDEPKESLNGEMSAPEIESKDRKKKTPFICMKDDSSEAVPEDSNTPFKIVKEDEHYNSIPLEERKTSVPNFNEKTKYESPKYARLAANKMTSEGQKLLCPQEPNWEDGFEALNVDEALNSSKYELMLLVPLKNEKQWREKRELDNAIKRDSQNNIWGNAIGLKEIESKKLGDDSLDIYTVEDIFMIHPATVHSEPTIQGDPLSSLVEEAIPKIGEAVTNGLGKAQNVTGSIEKLINEFEEIRNEAENVDEKMQFEVAVKNNPNGLLTHDFFHDTITNIKTFFNFLGGITHILFVH